MIRTSYKIYIIFSYLQGYEPVLKLTKAIDYQSLNDAISTTISKLDLIKKGPSDPQRPSWVIEGKVSVLRKDFMYLLSKETLTKFAFGVISNIVDAGTLFLNNRWGNACHACF